jgi:tetratricopeptide (TPR) repeat protein
MLRLSQATAKTARPRPWLRDVRFHNERVEAYLARSDETADVIVSAEPLAEAGTAPVLLTTEWFTAIANHLAPDGIFAQWLPVAHLDLNAMRPVFATVLKVFPHAEIWITSPDPENAMVGILASKSPFTPDRPSRSKLESLLSSSQETRDHLRRIELGSWPSLLSAYGGDAAVLRKLAQNAAPYGSFDHIPRRGIDALQETLLDVNTLLTERSAPRRLTADLSDSLRAVTAALFDQRPLVMRAKTAVLVGDDSSAVRLLTEIVESTPANEEASRVLGDILLRQAAGYVGAEQYGPALQLITRALTLMPVNTYLLRLLMISAFHVGDREASGLAIDGIRRLDPSHAGFRDNQATIRAQQGATDDALLLYENAITLDQTNEEFYCNMASFHYSQGRIWEAIRVLDQATKRAYYPAKPYYLKGLFYAEQGRIALALEAYESYLRVASPLDPHRAEVPRRIDELIEFREKQP